MNLVAMRTRFKAATSGLADDISDGEIDSMLNDMYIGFLPMDIDGKIHEVIWSVTLTPNINPITIPDHIYTFPTGNFWIHGSGSSQTGSIFPINYYEHLIEFTHRYPNYRDLTNIGRPQAVYLSAKNLYFDRFPDSNYILVADARGQQDSALTNEGLPFNMAMAVVTSAAFHYLLDSEDEQGYQREATRYQMWRSRVLRQSHGNYHDRVPNRSF